MPYLIQLTAELKTRVETVQKKNEDREKKEETQAKEKMNQPLAFVAHDLEMMMPNQPMLPAPGMYNSQPGGFPTGGFPPQNNYRGF